MSDRNRRRCVLRKTAVPDATHYVGYVEDQETPEMIMKKFEEMEKIKAASRRPAQAAAPAAAAAAAAVPADAAGPSGSRAVSEAAAAGSELTALEQQDADIGGEEAPLDQQQLQAIFKATSMYNVKSVLGNNEALMLDAAGKPQPDRGPAASDIAFDSESEDDLVAELRGFWSDDDWSKPNKKRDRSSKKPRGEGSSSRGRSKGMQRNARTCIIAQYNRDTHAFIRRRVRVADPDAILQLRLPPPPLPLSWGKAIRPFQPAAGAPVCSSLGADAAAGAAEAAGGAVVPRGFVTQLQALPLSRNCMPRVYNHGSSSSSSSGTAVGCGPPDAASDVHLAADLTAFDFKQLHVQDYQAVLINTGWEALPQQQQLQQPTPGQLQQQQHQDAAGPGPSSSAAAAAAPGVASWGSYGSDAHARHVGSSSSSGGSSSIVSRLEQLPVPSLCPRGFIMIWANKEHQSAVFRLMSRWGYSYVENLTWVLLAPNHSILQLPCANVQRSHITLYIFRKDGEGRDIELRHQRNPDVVFDYVRAVQGREWDVPVEVFNSVETLLPTGKGRFLELWAPAQAGRAGWTHLAEAAAAEDQ